MIGVAYVRCGLPKDDWKYCEVVLMPEDLISYVYLFTTNEMERVVETKRGFILLKDTSGRIKD